MVLQVSMECRFLAHSVASIDGMSLPRGFGCKYRLNVASSWIWVQVLTECRLLAFFSKIWFCGYRWNVASPRFLKFEVFSSLCFLFGNLGCGYQLKRCVSTIFFIDFASINEVSLSCDFEVLEVSNGVRILPIFGFCVSIIKLRFPTVFFFFEKPFFV